MFNFAVFRKTCFDTLPMLLVAGASIILFSLFFEWAMINMGRDLLAFASKWPFLDQMFRMSFGIDISNGVSLNVLMAVCFTHLFVLILTCGVVIATTTRVTTGEIEKGTADLLFTLPVTRTEVCLSTSAAWLLAIVVLSFCPLIGIAIGTLVLETDSTLQASKFLAPSINFLAFNLAVAGISALAASILNRRSFAISISVGVLMSSLLLNFLSPFLEWMQSINFLNLLNYFRPAETMRNGDWALQNILVLVAVFLVTWIASMVIFHRKDIPTA